MDCICSESYFTGINVMEKQTALFLYKKQHWILRMYFCNSSSICRMLKYKSAPLIAFFPHESI